MSVDGRLLNIENRLTKLEVVTEEKWKAHDEKSEIRWGNLQDDIKGLSKNIDFKVKLAIGIPASLFVLLKIGEVVLNRM